MNNNSIRVRFAPSPTGLMHLGNVRTALLNYLFARQKNGVFVLRIEDTDPARNFDPGAKKIIRDLNWLNLEYDEGPIKEGPYKPYFQSERISYYQEMLKQLQELGVIYRCFCTPEELEQKRQQQITLKLPPRYDRTCLNLSEDEIRDNLTQKKPFIWRMKIDSNESITIHDLARGSITFNLQHFSDFPLTRQDGSFTFIFANAVDDALMKINHVFRGEDHLSNTANQAVIYKALGFPLPTFWHLPILCNSEGKKLSKRDFGFSLQDLKNAGFLPEALANYLAIVGGGTFEHEIMTLDELKDALNFDDIHSTGHVRYDVEKLRWVNHKWIVKYPPEKLTQAARPFLEQAFPEAKLISDEKLTHLLQTVKTDLTTLLDTQESLAFYFKNPPITKEFLLKYISKDDQTKIGSIISTNLDKINNTDLFVETIKQQTKQHNIPLKTIFSAIRLALTGAVKGPSIHDLFEMLGPEKILTRLENLLTLLP